MGNAWGEFVLCSLQTGGLPLVDWFKRTDKVGQFSGSIKIPETYAKVFHPKTIGHRAVAEQVMLYVTIFRARRVLFIHRGNLSAFRAMVDNPANTRESNSNIIQYESLDVRGYETWISPDNARYIADTYNVICLCFESELI
jgi:hypothetical protein